MKGPPLLSLSTSIMRMYTAQMHGVQGLGWIRARTREEHLGEDKRFV